MNLKPVYLAVSDWESKGCAATINNTLVPTLKGFECIFVRILNTVLALAGMALLVMFVLGGFKLMAAGGDPKKAQAAHQTLTYAIIGLVTMIGAWFILLLLGSFLNINLTTFQISSPIPGP